MIIFDGGCTKHLNLTSPHLTKSLTQQGPLLHKTLAKPKSSHPPDGPISTLFDYFKCALS